MKKYSNAACVHRVATSMSTLPQRNGVSYGEAARPFPGQPAAATFRPPIRSTQPSIAHIPAAVASSIDDLGRLSGGPTTARICRPPPLCSQ